MKFRGQQKYIVLLSLLILCCNYQTMLVFSALGSTTTVIAVSSNQDDTDPLTASVASPVIPTGYSKLVRKVDGVQQ
ncbi:hypothetical protein [Paenibacillus silvae]|uniref:hypothetical protein n=1 Tax=Paenibacillus silvae TaxID=1325358 RepID=UPI0020041FAC|nr:hypothetical protein [Paenibacillus silvae]MCK6076353.1 hypothetical protein [Paenibacillus silvae]MCK6078292.1 hypothetical protein [Paenibacillus silvae]MCK6150488.1 hypothetical protein [Paenibacillus silvae]MCK6268748.1 hypothetical protein [Paenibacillus silvae]MCK6270341.1 hypothetical protein [Paenibacillus silvae]